MEKVILIRCGEIMLKGLNRPVFESKLISNIKNAISSTGKFKIFKSQGRIFVETNDSEFDFKSAMSKITKVFGVVSISPVMKIESDFESIKLNAKEMILEYFNKHNQNEPLTFKVVTKRGDKKFPLDSMQINAQLGEYILNEFPSLSVDVYNPDFKFYVEVRESTYMYFEIIQGQGGMPVGTNGKALLLLSGGIDSPVAGYMIAKRGVYVDAIHFYSYPYTSERAKEKVISLAEIMTGYCGTINLHVVPFTDIQLKINQNCPYDMLTIVIRRVMMRISEQIATNIGANVLATGESIGQVASQTMLGIVATDDAVNIPVFRPLIGMDKYEIINIAKKIGTYETSILPYEDCCTVFVPKHPKTKPTLEESRDAEKIAELNDLIEKAILETELIKLYSEK
jgi:thiamine biosynthesis protein ThiI